jgi:hypothetical protein
MNFSKQEKKAIYECLIIRHKQTRLELYEPIIKKLEGWINEKQTISHVVEYNRGNLKRGYVKFIVGVPFSLGLII